MKKIFLLLFVLAIAGSKNYAQLKCYTDEVHRQKLLIHPEWAAIEASMNKQLEEGIKKIDMTKALRTSDAGHPDSFWYDIPIVIHIVHDYNNVSDWLTDDQIFNDVMGWNIVYAGNNPDTTDIIPPFKKWKGNAHLRLHLATLDPHGNPTKGITRYRSYLTYIAGEQAKYESWPDNSYVNIWSVNVIPTFASGFTAAAYASPPASAATDPSHDGILCDFSYMSNFTGGYTINHEMGHIFNLIHTWGEGACATPGCPPGDDLVDDTPPTIGHLDCSFASLYDSSCAINYFKLYPSSTGFDSLVDYPDTANTQNIMDYSYCDKMFTKGQVNRMHICLNTTIAGRNNLWDSTNLVVTGALAPMPDLAPIPEFSAVPASVGFTEPYKVNYFTGYGQPIKFINESWNDTIYTVEWKFANHNTGAVVFDTVTNVATSTYMSKGFTQSGWLDLTMTAKGTKGHGASLDTNAGTATFSQAIFVSAASAVNGDGIFEEFNPSIDGNNWPSFNYYNNNLKWELCTNAGFYDNFCMKYHGYDDRFNPSMGSYPGTGTPQGDYDDLFSIPVNLSTFSNTDPCFLNFMYSGASRSSNGLNINDRMEIDCSTDNAKSWHKITSIGRDSLDNKGSLSIPYAPLYQGDWAPMAITVPPIYRQANTIFRFRYFPGVATDGSIAGYSSGNNFYMDRVNFSHIPAAVSNIKTDNAAVVIAPNPTQGNAYVIINDNMNTKAAIIVSDITGKVVFTTSQVLVNKEERIEIPQSSLTIKGIYLVQTITGTQSNTQKLIVY